MNTLIPKLFNFFIEKAYASAPTLTPDSSGGTAPNSAGVSQITTNLGDKIISILEVFAGIAAVAYFMWYGTQYITSGGSPEKAKTARQAIINGVIGVAVITGAYALIRLGATIANTVNGVVK